MSKADLLIERVRDGGIELCPLIDADRLCAALAEIGEAEGVDLDIWGLRERIQRDQLKDVCTEIWGFAESDRSADDPMQGNSEEWIRPRQEYLGFTESEFEPFDQAPTWDGIETAWNEGLTDDEFRPFVLWKALANASSDQPVLTETLRSLVADLEPFIQRIAESLIAGLPQRYDPSAYIISLIRTGRARISERTDIETWYKNVFDIDVSTGASLDSWGNYAGISRENVISDIKTWFGFEEGDYFPFNNFPFWNGNFEEAVPLDDDNFRLLVLWKMLANITTDANPENFLPEIFDGDVPETFPGTEPEPEPEPPLPPDYPYSQALYDRQDPTIQSQYSASERIIALVRSSRIRVLPDVDIETFFQNVFNISTAVGYGLDVWGRIVGIDRYLPMADTEQWFGFQEADFEPFGQCPMWDGRRNEWSAPLGDEEYRTLILWKALANICTADAYSLNNLLQELFPGKEFFVQESFDYKTIGGDDYLKYPNAQIYPDTFGFYEADYEPFNQAPLWDGRYYVRISNVMELTLYVFFDLKPYERAILEEYGLLAKGAGVGFNWIEIPLPVFGFAEADYSPFDEAPFWNGGYVKWEDNDYPYFGFLEGDCQPFSQAPFFEPEIPYYGFAEANCSNVMPFWNGKEEV